MPKRTKLKTETLASLSKIEAIFIKIQQNHGAHALLRSPDFFRLSEGLFLNAWTLFEAFIEELFVLELALDPDGPIKKLVKNPRTKNSNQYLAEAITSGLTAGEFVEWNDLKTVKARAEHLNLRNSRLLSLDNSDINSFERFKKLRNAIAHKSGPAKKNFLNLINGPPIQVLPAKRKGVTVGRVLCTTKVGALTVFSYSIIEIRRVVDKLVP